MRRNRHFRPRPFERDRYRSLGFLPRVRPEQYTGRENDGTGLYFYRARYYSPTLQRFASEDGIGLLGGNANLYAYSFNDPTYLTDPSGNCPACIIALIGGGIGGTVAGIEAYHKGDRGLTLIAAIAGGTGTGILAGLTGIGAGQLVGEALAPTIGSGLAGQLLNGAVGGAVGGAIDTGVNEGINGNLSAQCVIEGAADGALLGAAGVALGPVVQGGQNFNALTSPRTFGPRAIQAYDQAAISGGLGLAVSLSGRKNACH